MRGLFLGVLIALAAGTCSIAKTVTADDAAQFKVGVATVSDVEAKLGKPMVATNNSDGTVILTYYAGKTHVKGATFIPIVGLFAGGVDSQSAVLMFIFDGNGLLKSSSSSNSSFDCSSNIANTGCRSK
jgi:hypothetical protein